MGGRYHPAQPGQPASAGERAGGEHRRAAHRRRIAGAKQPRKRAGAGSPLAGGDTGPVGQQRPQRTAASTPHPALAGRSGCAGGAGAGGGPCVAERPAGFAAPAAGDHAEQRVHAGRFRCRAAKPVGHLHAERAPNRPFRKPAGQLGHTDQGVLPHRWPGADESFRHTAHHHRGLRPAFQLCAERRAESVDGRSAGRGRCVLCRRLGAADGELHSECQPHPGRRDESGTALHRASLRRPVRDADPGTALCDAKFQPLLRLRHLHRAAERRRL